MYCNYQVPATYAVRVVVTYAHPKYLAVLSTGKPTKHLPGTDGAMTSQPSRLQTSIDSSDTCEAHRDACAEIDLSPATLNDFI